MRVVRKALPGPDMDRAKSSPRLGALARACSGRTETRDVVDTRVFQLSDYEF
jgi:hypothetical protein